MSVARERGKRALRIAMIGMRGLPADLPKAGGGERETEAKAVRLAERGHEVTVYCRWHYNRYPPSPYRGVRLVSLPSLPAKSLDTLSHGVLATLHVIFRDTADIVSYHGMGNGILLPLAKLGGKRTVVYMDGLDWERPKWNRLARSVLRLGARLAFRMADAVYVDNRASKQAFAALFGREPEVITLAAERWDPPGHDQLAAYDLEPGRYLLFVGMLQPDKGVHHLIEAYETLDTALPLVIVGDNPQDPAYVRSLKAMAGDRVRFPGFVYGHAARQLFANCSLYVQPSIMEGNSPALMSAMACGRCVVISGIPQNIETAGDAGVAFAPGDPADLRRVLAALLADPARMRDLGARARERMERCYNWDAVVDQLERLYLDVAEAGAGPDARRR